MNSPALMAIAAVLSLLAYFFINVVLCTICLIPGCALASVGITFFAMFFMWVLILFSKSFQ